MVHPLVYPDSSKNKGELKFKSAGGDEKDEDIEKAFDSDFWMEEDFTFRTSWSPRYCSLRSLYISLTFSLTLFLTLLLLQNHFATRNQFLTEFQAFNTKFNKKYDNSDEFQLRFHQFQQNLKEINELNRANSNVEFSWNQFTDLSEIEIKSMLLDKKFLEFHGNLTMSNLEMSLGRPDYKDWRDDGKVMSVKNQGSCGSCWAFSVVSSVESQFAIKKGTLWSLSEQELVDCEGDSHGCSGGFLDKALGWVLGNGLETEDDYPYSASEHDQCYLDSGKTRVRIDEGYRLANDENYIADWVANVGPVSFGMGVPKSFPNYRNGIYNPSDRECREESLGGHAMTIIGYGSESGQDYWIIKNSWGGSWGDQGYMRMARGRNVCGMAENVVAPVIN